MKTTTERGNLATPSAVPHRRTTTRIVAGPGRSSRNLINSALASPLSCLRQLGSVSARTIQPSPHRSFTQPSPQGFALQLELPRLRDQLSPRLASARRRPSPRIHSALGSRRRGAAPRLGSTQPSARVGEAPPLASNNGQRLGSHYSTFLRAGREELDILSAWRAPPSDSGSASSPFPPSSSSPSSAISPGDNRSRASARYSSRRRAGS